MASLDDLIASEDLPRLIPALLRRLVSFLNRWERYEDTLIALAAHQQLAQVSLLDAQITALAGLNRYAEAIQVSETRLEQKESNTSRLNFALLHLENGDLRKAQALVQALSDAAPDYHRVHLAFGRIALQMGDLDKAEGSLLEFQKHYPNSRSHLPYLARIALRRGDRLTAGAYAVRAFSMDEGLAPLPVYLLRDLREVFADLGDERRCTEADALLAQRARTERAEIVAALTEKPGERPTPAREKTVARARPSPPAMVPAPPLPDLNAVPVSEQEHAEVQQAARELFDFQSLRPAQVEIMACVRRRENVLAVLPTGAGKSLCYQLPAFMAPGLTLVVSPLIALMKDQLDGLPARLRPRAIALNSTLDGPALARAIDEIAAGHYRLVYVAPERLRQLPFLAALAQAGLTRLVIDEAHCVSVWGHDFRPDYLYIADAWEEIGGPPILALTATAPPRVREDIERRLYGTETGAKFRYIALDTFRPNLRLGARRAKNEDEKKQLLVGLCLDKSGSGIVYARTRQKCEDLAAMLRAQGVSAVHYHAGITDRASVQERFMSGEADVIVATVAFGMGVDKADIRFIIHYDLPDSIEAYYQEAGRAGRDGFPADCILLFTSADRGSLTRRANQSAIPIDYLRQVYNWLRRILPDGKPGLVSLRELVIAADGDEVKTRVSLSLLEQAGLLQRHHDAPVQVSLRPLPDQSNPGFETFVETADLTPFQPNQRAFLELAASVNLTPAALEYRLLKWAFAGLLEYRPVGRMHLYTIPPPPDDASRRLDALLDQYTVIQGQRVQEIWDYANTGYCRHGHLAAYLGGAAREKCEACDTCEPGLSGIQQARKEFEAALPSEVEQYQAILNVLKEHGWGRVNLVALLVGDRLQASNAAQNRLEFGKLAFRSATELEKMVVRLLEEGFLNERRLSHGGMILELSRKGHTALNDSRSLEELAPSPSINSTNPNSVSSISRAIPKVGIPPDAEPDPDLYEALITWCLDRARQEKVQTYRILPKKVMAALATVRPQTLTELEAIKGVGPKKLELFGEEILDVLKSTA